MPNPFLYKWTVLFQTIQFIQTILIQTIQFSISTYFSFIWLSDRTLSGATTPVQSKLGSFDNKEVSCIPQSSSITGLEPHHQIT